MAVGALLLGAVVGFVGALVGAGGGFIAMPVLLFLYGLPPVQASRVSLVLVLASASCATLVYARQGLIDLPRALLLASTGIAGSILGARLAPLIPPARLIQAFGLLLVLLGLVLWLERGRSDMASNAITWRSDGLARLSAVLFSREHSVALGLGSMAVGGLASLFGIGGGPLLVPLLTLKGGMETHSAIGTSQLIILLTSLAGILGHARIGGTDWGLAGGLALGALVGSPLGALTSPNVGGRRLLRLLALCLFLLGFQILVK